ncbi:hypothetical protein GCM10010409_23500 [Mycolicibacterium diernhoferi]
MPGEVEESRRVRGFAQGLSEGVQIGIQHGEIEHGQHDVHCAASPTLLPTRVNGVFTGVKKPEKRGQDHRRKPAILAR